MNRFHPSCVWWTARFASFALVAWQSSPPAGASDWQPQWTRLIPSDGVFNLVQLIGRSGQTTRIAGRATHDVAGEPADVEGDLFQVEIDSTGGLISVKSFSQPGQQSPYGVERSFFGSESWLITDGVGGEIDAFVQKRSPSGPERWRFDLGKAVYVPVGLVRDWRGNHWVARKPGWTGEFIVTKIRSNGTAAWKRKAEGLGSGGDPKILRYSGEDLVVGISAGFGKPPVVACYRASDFKHLWSAVVEPAGSGPSRSYNFRDLHVAKDGTIFTCINRRGDRPGGLSWVTTLSKFSKDGTLLNSVEIPGETFCGWRLATDHRGHLYVGGTDTEPGNPWVAELDSALGEVSRIRLGRTPQGFLRGLHVSPSGNTLTAVGTCGQSWNGYIGDGGNDHIFAVRYVRE